MNDVEAKTVTRYKNEVNSIPMRKWTAEEMDFFFAVLTRVRDEGTNLIIMDKNELADLARYTIYSNRRYHDVMDRLSRKVGQLQYFKKTSNSLVTMPLFTFFEANWTDDLSEMTIEIEVNKRFELILNEWNEGNWTQFMLEEFLELQSTYSKSLFRLLKQWRTIGVREFSLAEFKQLMDIPESYTAGMINKRIVNNSIQDLKPYFENLKVEVLKSNSRGNPIRGFKFTWKPQITGVWDENKYSKRSDKKVNLPDWILGEQAKDDLLPLEEQEIVRKKINRIRK